MLTLPIFTRYLSPEEFGTIALLIAFGLVCRAIFGLGFGVSTGIVYFRAAVGDAQSGVAKTAFILTVLASLALLAIVVPSAPTLSWLVLGGSNLFGMLILFTIAAALQNMLQPALMRIQFLKKPFRYVILSTGSAMIGVAVALWLVAVEGRGVSGWVEGTLIGALLGVIGGVLFNRDAIRAPVDWRAARELMRLGLPVVPSLGFMFVVQNSGTYTLQHLAGLDQVGIYGIGLNMGLAMGLFAGAFFTAWTPFFQSYATHPADAPQVFRQVAVSYAAIGGFLAVLFFTFAKPVIVLLTEPEFHDAYRIVGIAAFGQYLLGVWVILLPGIYFAGKTYVQTAVQAVTAAIVVGLNFLLIPTWGIEGAALAMSIGMLAMVVLLAAVNRIKGYEAMAFSLVPVTLIGALMVPVALLQRLLDEVLSLVPATTIGIGIAVLYAGVGFRFLEPPVRRRLRAFVPGMSKSA